MATFIDIGMTFQLMKKLSRKSKAVTFDEMTLRDFPSEIHPNDVDLSTHISRNIRLKGAGIMSAAMDSVTEASLALALAKMGGMGILHRNLSPEEQAAMVRWVRKQIYHGGMIEKPITFWEGTRVSEMQAIIERKNYHFTGFPIVDDLGTLVGMISCDEMEFAENRNPELRELMKTLDSVVIGKGMLSSEEAYNLMKKTRVKKLPIVDNNGQLLGMYVWNDLKDDARKKKMFSLDSNGHFLVGAAIGVSEEDMHRVELLIESGCKLLVIDTSHGACKPARDQLTRIKKFCKTKNVENVVDVMVGNVASYESAKYLLENEYPPDALKAGIGPGSICTTREVTGHGVPQLTAIFEVYRAVFDFCLCRAHNKDGWCGPRTGLGTGPRTGLGTGPRTGLGTGPRTGLGTGPVNQIPWIPIIADGGIRSSGDIVKAFAVGASGVMMGSIFAGTKESPGQIVTKGNMTFKTIRGMGSKSAMAERAGSRKRYFSETSDLASGNYLTSNQKMKVVPEGIEGLVQIRGSVESVMDNLLGGIRAGFSHSGACQINSFRQKAEFWNQSHIGTIEGRPHDIRDVHE